MGPTNAGPNGAWSLQQAFASLPSNITSVLPKSATLLGREKADFPPGEPIETAKCYTTRHLMRKYGRLTVFPGHLMFRSSSLNVIDPLLGQEKLVWSIPDDFCGMPEKLLDKPGIAVWVRHNGTGKAVHSEVLESESLNGEESEEEGRLISVGKTPSASSVGASSDPENDVLPSSPPKSPWKPSPIRTAVAVAAALRLSRPMTRQKIVFVFNSSLARDKCYDTLLEQLGYQADQGVSPESRPASPSGHSVVADLALRAQTPPARNSVEKDGKSPSATGVLVPVTPTSAGSTNAMSEIANAITSSFSKVFSPTPKLASTVTLAPPTPFIVLTPTSQRITILTVGSRGDVQPYIALGKRLREQGNRVSIATHPEYEKWIRSHGLKFRLVKGDPAMVMSVMSETGHSTYAFVKEANAKLRPWLSELMMSGFEACQGSDVILAGPSAVVGLHVAEALGLPFMFVMPMPWTSTKAFPHPFMTPNADLGGIYNEFSFGLVDRAIYIALLQTLNKWRRNVLGVPATTLAGPVDPIEVPTLYAYSPSVLPRPPDWPDNIHVCGYWFLNNPDVGWTPPQDLLTFLERKTPTDRVVYIGFGSIIVPDAKGLTRTVVDAVRKSGVRVVLSKGWSGRKHGKEDEKGEKSDEEELPSDIIYQVSSIPHDWLFPRVDAVVHHGGAGTVAAGLREGKPTVICPFFGDQFFWGSRVDQLGVGVCVRKLNTSNLCSALTTVTSDVDMQQKAEALGASIRAEDGLDTAIQAFWQELPRARKVIEDLRDQHEFRSDLELRDPTRSFLGDDYEPSDQDWTAVEHGEHGAEPRRRSLRETLYALGGLRAVSPPPTPKCRTPSPTRTTQKAARQGSFEYADSLRPRTAGGLSAISALSSGPLLAVQARRSSQSSPALNTLDLSAATDAQRSIITPLPVVASDELI